MLSIALLAGLLFSPSSVSNPALYRYGSMVERNRASEDTTLVPLTTDALHQLITFWQRFQKEPAALRDTTRQAPERVFVLSPPATSYGGIRHNEVTVVDIAVLATTAPRVAADLRAAGLTTGRWEQLQRTLYTALWTVEAEAFLRRFQAPASAPPPPLLQQNVVFVQAHPQEIAALRAAGMGLPPLKIALNTETIIGHPMPRLDVKHWLNGGWSVRGPGGAQLPFGDGHVYVVEFTAHYCGPCRSTYPMLAALQAKYAARGVRVLYLTGLMGFFGDQDRKLPPAAELDSLRRYAVQHELHAPLAIVGPELFPGSIPDIVVVDGRGIVAPFDNGNVTAVVDSVLASTQAATPPAQR